MNGEFGFLYEECPFCDCEECGDCDCDDCPCEICNL